MRFKRTIELIGPEKFALLTNSTVLVVGLGGVGGHACEALARSGIGHLILVDKGVVDISNINRQVLALTSTIGLAKTEVMKARILEINPEARVDTYYSSYDEDTKSDILNHDIDFICDCIDTITWKIDLIKEALERNIKIISSMGMGNKLHPELIEISELKKTAYDPIARVIRTKFKRERIHGKVPVIYSRELPFKEDTSRTIPASNAFVPATAGLIAASYIVNTLIQ